MEVTHEFREVDFDYEYEISEEEVPTIPEYEDDFPAYRWVHKLTDEYLKTAPSYVQDRLKRLRPTNTTHSFDLVGNCAYLFESDGFIRISPKENSYNKPFLLTFIYLFEENDKMKTEDDDISNKTESETKEN